MTKMMNSKEQKEERNINVAVYGSLKQGFGNHGRLSRGNSEFVKQVTVDLPFYMVSLGAFPALIPSEENHSINVELYKVDDRTFRDLDCLEGYPSFYDRKLVNINNEDYYIYFLHNNRGYDVVEDGNWKK